MVEVHVENSRLLVEAIYTTSGLLEGSDGKRSSRITGPH